MDEEEAEFVPVLVPHADESGTAVDTSNAPSVLQCAQSQEHRRSQHQLSAQLGRLKQETSRYRATKSSHPACPWTRSFSVSYVRLCCPLQVVGGAAAEGEGVPAGPEEHAAAENKRAGAGQSQAPTRG